jgi:hypothetical protein
MVEAQTETGAVKRIGLGFGYIALPAPDAPTNPRDIKPLVGPTWADVQAAVADGWRVVEEYDSPEEEKVYILLSKLEPDLPDPGRPDEWPAYGAWARGIE